MKAVFTFLTIILSTGIFHSIAGTPYYFDHFDIEDGLSQNTVTCIFQDSKGFMWFGTKNGLNRFDGYTFKIYSRNHRADGLGNSIIYCITEDRTTGNLWIGTDKGAYIFDPRTEKFEFFDRKTSENRPMELTLNKIIVYQNEVWMLTGLGIYVFNRTIGKFASLASELNEFSTASPSDICIDDNKIWISIPSFGIIAYENKKYTPFYTDRQTKIIRLSTYRNLLLAGTPSNGLFLIDKATKSVRHTPLKQPWGREKESTLIHVITAIDNTVWIGTEDGIYIYSPQGMTHLSHHPGDPYSLSNNAVYSIYQDSDKGIWVGSYFGGIDYIPKHDIAFEKYYPSSDPHSIGGSRVREMCEDKSGNLWIATEDNGLNYYDTRTKRFTRYSTNTEPIRLSYTNIQCLNLTGDKLWIGYYHKGIDVLDLNTRKIEHFEQANTPALDNNDIFTIYTDLSGQTWIGTSTGVLKYNARKNEFTKCPEIGTFYISDIHQDPEGYIWFATYNIGAIRYNTHDGTCKRFSHDPHDSTSICYNRITTIFEDDSQRLWFGSEDGGFCLYDNKTETFMQITTKDGLPSNVIHKILEDNRHTLWISTNNGLANYDPETGKIRNYNTSNGLLSKQFNYNSGIATADGKLYFGNISGMIAFSPNETRHTDKKLSVVLTKFQLFNQDIEIGSGNSSFDKVITYTDTIRLHYDQSSLNLEFSTLNYASIETNQYAYKLEGIDKDWIFSRNRQASYSHILPGEYTFRVKANNSDGKWDNPETVLQIVITPPWWQTNLAKAVYTLMVLALITSAGIIYKKRTQRKYIKQQQERERKKQEEIYTAKIDFFTNIAHEIRTPLTLIKVPLDSILGPASDPAKFKEYLQIIKRNTDRLFFLINQLLDFRKTESKILKLNKKDADINLLISDMLIRFEPVMEQTGLSVHLDLPDSHIIASIDKEAITKVCSNLFTNATKYARTCVDISLSVADNYNYFELRVSNDGEPIQPEYRQKIFEAFFQIDDKDRPQKSGSGLGLALAHSLVELHKGRIFVDEEAENTTFVVQIPLEQDKTALPVLPEPDFQEEWPAENDKDEDGSTESPFPILIVEDNEELLNFIAESLSKKYKTLTAANGMEALKILDKEKISLVISDIIMPIMDGIELCNRIASDLSTCHIPVILLTAKTNLDSKIKALKNGAAAYIEKPFSMPYLEAQIANLIENQHKLHKNFARNPLLGSSTIARNKTDEKFLNKLTEIINQNLDKENFNVDNLANEVNMSRTSLHRKLKEISGLTPGDFIRLVRLKKAAELLQNGEYRINEICILVGIHSQSYFTKSFQKQFGILPKDFAKTTVGSPDHT